MNMCIYKLESTIYTKLIENDIGVEEDIFFNTNVIFYEFGINSGFQLIYTHIHLEDVMEELEGVECV